MPVPSPARRELLLSGATLLVLLGAGVSLAPGAGAAKPSPSASPTPTPSPSSTRPSGRMHPKTPRPGPDTGPTTSSTARPAAGKEVP